MNYINSEAGRLGPFSWVNGVHSKITLHNATYNGSIHYAWRPGICGLDPWFPIRTFAWKLIRP